MHPLSVLGRMTRFLLVAAFALAACTGSVAPEPTPDDASDDSSEAAVPAASPDVTPSPQPVAMPAPSRDPATGVARRQAYIDAICPTFLDIVVLDPRLADLRAAGAAGGDVTDQGGEIEDVASELRLILNDLDAVPDWTPGRTLRSELTVALHEMRSALLFVAETIDRHDAADRLAAVPYIARPSLDRAMMRAANAGLDCTGFEY